MSAWRRKALALFPDHRDQFARPEFTLPEVYAELLHVALRAHASEADDPGTADQLRRIHGFAEWCLHEQGHLWTAAAIGFYEDLLATADWDTVIPWLSPYVVEQIEATWALGIKGERAARFRELVASRKRHAYREHAYATGVVQSL